MADSQGWVSNAQQRGCPHVCRANKPGHYSPLAKPLTPCHNPALIKERNSRQRWGASLKIRISQYAFLVGAPYRAGHSLTANEAEALNRLRAENIRNNVKRWVDQAEPTRGLIPQAELNALAERIAQYAQGYEFAAPAEPKGGIRKTGFETEIENIARERVEAKLRLTGITLSKEAHADAIEGEMKLSEVQLEARKRFEARATLAANELKELLS